jgi:dihydrofolate synthase / folylpolyglutamate synthase
VTPEESFAWLFSTHHFGIKLGLDNIRRLLAAMGNPQDGLRIIHVAGTNGKGSTCAMLDAISRESARKTGLYTSPHLVDFRERFRVNGEKIGLQKAGEILSRIRELTKDWDHVPTFFEITTALALRHFADEQCELVILETGMGGRLDATNAVIPRASVITSISLDHTQYLGENLTQIAGEKAGIIKKGVPVVSTRQTADARRVLEEVSAENSSALEFVDTAWTEGEIALHGEVQRQNAALAIAALRAAGFSPSDMEIREGLRKVYWPGRFQMLDGGIVLDGGHNPQACSQLVRTWREQFGDEKATLIFGALADKAYGEMLEIIRPIVGRISFVPVKSQRGCPPEELAAKWAGFSKVYPSLSEAVADNPERPLLIAGSLFLVGEAFEVLGLEP